MRRREFISVIGGAAAWPVTARAQQIERPRRIGILLGSYSSTDQAGQVRIGTLLKTLRELGWEEGRNLSIDYRWGAGNTEQNIKFAAELVQSAPDAIIATSDPVVATPMCGPLVRCFPATRSKKAGQRLGSLIIRRGRQQL
jgi:putative ABC transport system substrate-binding protein